MDGAWTPLRVLQWSLIAIGLALVGFWSGAHLHGWLGGRAAIESFAEARASALLPVEPAAETPSGLPVDLPVDTTLWAEDRIAEYEASLSHEFEAPLAVLRIPKIGLEVAVLAGTDELALNRGVGHIAGTPPPGAGGNCGIAGHRDGYFRGLKDIAIGDAIELETLDGAATYEITEILIVKPSDVWVLNPTAAPSLTLVTCYPFYFVGSAPQRFIVRAERSTE
ncbi:MAG: class D sortase [Thermoanaerobaculales bacterium]|jgi:sortase A|nr:class D sortase [Thermoanaerobaculales bacterium]